MASVSVNGPKTPVTEGSNGVAAATIPNVCKMPGPPAPFVPTPLPNIGKSGNSPKDFSQDVKFDGNKVAIRGATFKSMGDVASQGTGGGLVSSNVEGPTAFVGPGSMDVKVEGKNVQLLTDPMLNNCGPSGSPPNAATMMGIIQASGLVTVVPGTDPCPNCNQSHGALAESATSKADAGSLASALKNHTQPKQVARDGKSKKVDPYVQTMLGVVHGKCSKKYADQSNLTYKELCDAAGDAGMVHPGVASPSYYGGITREDVDSLSDAASEATHQQVPPHLRASEAFTHAWKNADDLSKQSMEGLTHGAYFPPGSCAGQKAIVLALEKKCYPGAITEQWYSSKGKPIRGGVAHQRQDADGGLSAVVVTSFDHGTTVPPCGTCCMIVPLLLCSEKEECSH